MVGAILFVADAADEGRKVVLSMLVTGLVFVAVIVIGQFAAHLGHKRKAARRRPL
jgi:hypothetical protein